MHGSRLAVLISLLSPVSLSAVSCSAESRLWRISPVTGSNPSDPERVTLWPIMYVDSTSAAVLWPLMDFDERGFAVRPLVAKDDTDLDILYPLSHFDLANGNGWALTAYSYNDHFGIFPLCHLGPEFSIVPPAYWSQVDGEFSSGGVFPIAYYDSVTGDGYFLTAYAFGLTFGLFPLLHLGPDFNFVGPVWWDGGEDAEDDDYGLFPLYYHCADDQGATTVFVPFYWYGEQGTRRELITPLGGRGWDESGATSFVNVLGPIFHHSDDGEEETTALLWPLYLRDASEQESDTWLAAGLAHVGTTAEGGSWRLWPLASASTDEQADGWIDEITLFRHDVRGESTRSWLFPVYHGERGPDVERDEFLFTLARHVETSAGTTWRVWPLVSSTESVVDDAPGLDDLVDAFSLFGLNRGPERFHLHAGTPLLFDLERRGEELQSWDLHALTLVTAGHHEQPRSSADSPPASRVCFERNHAGFLFDWFKVERRTMQETDGAIQRESHYRLPLLHEYESTPERTEWDLLCYAVHGEETPAESKLSVLGYAWRSTTTATETHCDVFPAITYDRTPDSARWSFLWRLLHYRREGERVGGHVLFIPWGDA